MSDSRTLLNQAARRLAAAGVDTPRLDARVLWEHAQQQILPLKGGGGDPGLVPGEPEGVMTSPPLAGEELRAAILFESFLARRLAREPLAAITGHKEFWSLDFAVDHNVLIPRPESETIIEQALALLPDRRAPLRLLDLGTGSGCLLVALLKEFPNATGLGVDVSEKALAVAHCNIARYGLAERAELRAGNWGEGLDGPFDLIVSNPPYIQTAELAGLAPELRSEPVTALDGGADGFASIRLLAEAMARLLSGLGLVEIGAGQGAEAAAIFAKCGMEPLRIAADLAGIPRVLVTRGKGKATKKVLESGEGTR